MKIRVIVSLMMILALASCGKVQQKPDTVPLEGIPTSVTVKHLSVRVPPELVVSEANRYYPRGDIVWREGPAGGRHAQVQAIVEEAMQKGIQGLEGDVPVDLDIEVRRFHALSEKTRSSFGGVHAVHFYMTLRDPRSGALLGNPRLIQADFEAYGGAKALAAEKRGETQKVRIIDHLSKVIRQELVEPGSYKPKPLGLMRLFD